MTDFENEVLGMLAGLRRDVNGLRDDVNGLKSQGESYTHRFKSIEDSLRSMKIRYQGIDAGLQALRSPGIHLGMGGLPPQIYETAERSTTPSSFVFGSYREYID